MRSLKIARGFALPLDVAGEAIGLLATRGAGKSYTSAVLVEELFAAGVQVVVLDPTGVYWGLRGSGEKEGLPIYVFGGPHGDLPLEATAGGLFADLAVDNEPSFVLDLSGFDTKAEQTRFVTAFADRLYRRKAQNRETLVLVIDEADEFAPQRPMRDEPRMLGAMEAIVRRGRSRGLGVVLITQRSAALNKNVLDLIETLFVMRTLGPRDRKAIEGWIEMRDLADRKGVLESLPSLPTGTAWVWSPVRDILERIAIRKIRTFDSYRTPKPGETRAEPKEIAPIDLGDLGEKMAQTVEQAKARDPAELRKQVAERDKQIAKLERDLAERPSEEVIREVEKIVEVPVLDGQLDELDSALAKMMLLSKTWEQAGFRIANSAQSIVDALRKTTEEAHGVRAAVVAATVDRRREPTPRPARAEPRSAAPAARDQAAARERRLPEDGSISQAGRRILDTLAWLSDVGFPQPSKVQTGLLAGYRVTKKLGGTYSTELALLKDSGHITYPSPGRAALTDVGRALASPPDIEMTTAGLQRAVLARLDSAERRVLEELLAVYPESLHKVELGTRAGYQVTSKLGGTFSTVLAKLKSLGLLDYPAPGLARSSDLLFLE